MGKIRILYDKMVGIPGDQKHYIECSCDEATDKASLPTDRVCSGSKAVCVEDGAVMLYSETAGWTEEFTVKE